MPMSKPPTCDTTAPAGPSPQRPAPLTDSTGAVRVASKASAGKLPGTGLFLYFDDPVASDADDLFVSIRKLGFESVFYIAKNYDGRVSFFSRHAPQAHEGLARACDLGSKHGLSVYAVLMTFIEGYEGAFGSGFNRDVLGPAGRLAAIDRDGRSNAVVPVSCDRGQGYYCCPARPEVRDRFNSIARETDCYPISGIHLDCVRYPMPGDYCYCDYCCSEFRKLSGGSLREASLTDVERWRCSVVGRLVRELAGASALGGGKTLSALVWRGRRAYGIGQDWANWPVDFVTPMYYSDHYIERVSKTWARIRRDEGKGVPVIPAIGGDLHLLSRWRLRRLLSAKDVLTARSVMVGHYDTRDCIATLSHETGLLSVCKELRLQGRRVKRTVAGPARQLLNRLLPR